MIEKLGKYFTVQEFEHSATAIRYGWKNSMNAEEKENARHLVEQVLDPLREYLKRPLVITSGYRSKVLNTRIGGSKTSQHCKGEAADVHIGAKGFRFIRENLDFDQLIWEYGDDHAPQWVHVSKKRKGVNRKEVLRVKVVNGRKVTVKL